MPALPAGFVVRTGVRAALGAAGVSNVVLVCAPAGFGKTVALADWCRSSVDADTAWVNVDRDDNDPRRLWSAVVAAVGACPSVPPSSRLCTPEVWRVGSQPDFLAELVDALQVLPRPIRLVLDDLHELVDPEVLHGVETLMRNCPASVQLVLSSRFDPPLSLARVRLAGRLWELRADRLRFSPAEAAALLAQSGLSLSAAQLAILHQRTEGWAAGLRLAALAVLEAPDGDAFLADFSGDQRSVADYLVGEILSRMPEDIQEFLRVTSISDPIPSMLAAELSGREDAGSVLDGLERATSLVVATGPRREAYRVQPLLRSYLLADLHRQGPKWAAQLHGKAAWWWAGQHRPIEALSEGTQTGDSALLSELVRRFTVPLMLTGHHPQLRGALTAMGPHTIRSDPWLALTSALTRFEANDYSAVEGDLRHARQNQGADESTELTVLRAVAEQWGVLAGVNRTRPGPVPLEAELPAEPDLEALTHLSRGAAHLLRGDHLAAARAELETALALADRHDFDYLSMQCLAMLGVIAGVAGDLRTTRVLSSQVLTSVTDHHWENSPWSTAATTMLAYTALLRAEPEDAQRLAGDGLRLGHAVPAQLRFALRTVNGAALFDRGERVRGLAELQQARTEFGELPTRPEQLAAAALLELRAALQLGHAAAARTAQSWFAARSDNTAETLLMSAWTEAASGRPEHARTIIGPILNGTSTPLLSHTPVEAWLLETTLALTMGERPAARRALQNALAAAEPLDALRPFTHAGNGVRDLLVHQHGSFGINDQFADHALTATGHDEDRSMSMLSERELTVLSLLHSPLSLDEISTDLSVSVNTVKSHVRSIYIKLGVSSRRTAVLSAYDHGLLTKGTGPH